MADDNHAKRVLDRHVRRAVRLYDGYREFGYEEIRARGKARYHLRRWAHLDYLSAAELLADALARRAANKLGE